MARLGKILSVLIIFLFLSGCSVKAVKDGDTLTLSGWGAKSAEWPEGYKISKEEPIRVPNIAPIGRQ